MATSAAHAAVRRAACQRSPSLRRSWSESQPNNNKPLADTDEQAANCLSAKSKLKPYSDIETSRICTDCGTGLHLHGLCS